MESEAVRSGESRSRRERTSGRGHRIEVRRGPLKTRDVHAMKRADEPSRVSSKVKGLRKKRIEERRHADNFLKRVECNEAQVHPLYSGPINIRGNRLRSIAIITGCYTDLPVTDKLYLRISS
jgi:hypothetical protein